MFDFSDRVVIVTGAAGNLGSAVARAFQAAGAKLGLVDRAADRLPRLFPDLVDSPNHFLATSVDLTNADAVEAVHAKSVEIEFPCLTLGCDTSSAVVASL